MKILIIQFYQTGDVVLTTHIPREVKKLFPDSEIDFLTFKVNEEIVKHNPYISEVLTTTRKATFKETISHLIYVRKKKYDIVLDYHDNPRSLSYVLFSGAKQKIIYEDSTRKFFYNNPVPRLKGTAVDIKMSLLAPFTKNPLELDKQTEIYFSDKEKEKIGDLINSWGIKPEDFVVTVSPTHKRTARRWAFRHFFDTAVYLEEKYGAKIIYTYGPGEKEYIDEHLESMGGIRDNMFIMPSLSLGEFTALLDRANLHIGNDSAPHHIATARKVPTFVVIGSTSEGWVFPSKEHTYARADLDCVPCKKTDCIHGDTFPCLNDFGFKDIKNKLEKFITDVVLR